MDNIEQNLANWRASCMTSIPIGGLLARNGTAYKWKAGYRCWLLREASLWRVSDLLTQSYELHQHGHGLGARILLRSAFETLAVLIYLNHNMRAVLEGKLDFHDFSKLTSKQAVGSKNNPSGPIAVNVLTMLDKGEKLYPGLRGVYDSLSESAHPNFEGMVWGYSKVNHGEHETSFSNRWMGLYGDRHLNSLELFMIVFDHEYQVEWPGLMERLEGWIVENDTVLEVTKPRT